MKALDRLFLIAALVSVALLAGISSCDYFSKEPEPTVPTKETFEASLKGTQWKIAKPLRAMDRLHPFTGYSLHFNSDGSLTAVQNAKTFNGMWTAFNSHKGKVKLNLEITDDAKALSEDWIIVENTESRIVLQEIRGEQNAGKVVLERV